MADELFPVCSPALLTGKQAAAHARRTCATTMLLHTSGGNSDDWRLWLTAAGLPSDISKQPGITFDLILMTVQAAIDGIGVAMGRTSYVEDDIAKGRLVVPFKIALPADAGFYLVSPEGDARIAEARGVPAMADRLGAEQSLKNRSAVPRRYPLRPAFSGWSRRAGMADCRTRQSNCRLARELSAPAARKTGRNSPCRRPATSQPPQIKSRIGAILRATSGNFLEQFDFFLFGFYASAIAKAFFPAAERDRGAAQHLRRVLARRADAPGRRDRARRLYRPHRPPPGPDRHARRSWRSAPW